MVHSADVIGKSCVLGGGMEWILITSAINNNQLKLFLTTQVQELSMYKGLATKR